VIGSRTTSRTSGSGSRADGEAGVGLVGSLAGVTAFLVLLLFAVHLVLNLYATSVVTAAAFDAARVVAGADGDEAAAERQARELLDGYAPDELSFEWRTGPDVVELRVVARHPTSLLPAGIVPFQEVDRTVRVRVERFR
jgi:hypothetical protein